MDELKKLLNNNFTNQSSLPFFSASTGRTGLGKSMIEILTIFIYRRFSQYVNKN